MNDRRLTRLLLGAVTAALLALPQAAFACSVCFGKSDSALLKGMQMGVLALLLVVVCVLGGFAAFFIYLAKRAAMASEPPGPPATTDEIVSRHE